jgi:SH3 domain protein
LSSEPPKGPALDAAREKLQALRAEYDQLKDQLGATAAEGSRAAEEAEGYRARLEAVEHEFAAWKEENKDAIALKTRAEALETAQQKDQIELDRLRVENRKLQAREKFYWFFSGVVVLLLGWVLGYFYASSRHRAKSQSRFKF